MHRWVHTGITACSGGCFIPFRRMILSASGPSSGPGTGCTYRHSSCLSRPCLGSYYPCGEKHHPTGTLKILVEFRSSCTDLPKLPFTLGILQFQIMQVSPSQILDVSVLPIYLKLTYTLAVKTASTLRRSSASSL